MSFLRTKEIEEAEEAFVEACIAVATKEAAVYNEIAEITRNSALTASGQRAAIVEISKKGATRDYELAFALREDAKYRLIAAYTEAGAQHGPNRGTMLRLRREASRRLKAETEN